MVFLVSESKAAIPSSNLPSFDQTGSLGGRSTVYVIPANLASAESLESMGDWAKSLGPVVCIALIALSFFLGIASGGLIGAGMILGTFLFLWGADCHASAEEIRRDFRENAIFYNTFKTL